MGLESQQKSLCKGTDLPLNNFLQNSSQQCPLLGAAVNMKHM